MELEEKKNMQVSGSSVKNSNNNFNQNEDEDINAVPIYRKKRVVIPFLILIVAAVLGTMYWYMNMRNFVSTDDAFVDADRISISSKVLGRITSLTVDEGDTVTKSDIVIKLDDTDLQSQLELAKANLVFAEKRTLLAQVNINRAKDDFQRAQLQFNKAVITKEQFIHAQKTLEGTQAEYDIAVAQVNVSKAQISVVEAQLQNMQIAIPFNGVVAKRWVMNDEIVQPGQPILSIYDLNNIWITSNLEETKLGNVIIGDFVEISIDTYPDYKFEGKVIQIGDYTASEFSLIPPNNASGNFTKVTQRVPIKIELTNLIPEDKKKYPLRPGMSAEIKIKIK